MKAASLRQVKEQLELMPQEDLLALTLRLIKFKKENKELATYNIFYNGMESDYVQEVKEELNTMFEDVNQKSFFLAKRTLRKMLRHITKFSRYSPEVSSVLEFYILFCELMVHSNLSRLKSTALKKMYEAQLKKINTLVKKLHPDLQYDYKMQLESLPDVL